MGTVMVGRICGTNAVLKNLPKKTWSKAGIEEYCQSKGYKVFFCPGDYGMLDAYISSCPEDCGCMKARKEWEG